MSYNLQNVLHCTYFVVTNALLQNILQTKMSLLSTKSLKIKKRKPRNLHVRLTMQPFSNVITTQLVI